ncbi:lipopolysaccharide transport periplasmic protein LptA [bacterium]|nr:lipopolysaccharide transport periplasmic protein LptA [bacterium]MBU1995469.1 lipopolysaccharide transport periplasmic protein LptA [bacterium]
MKFLTFLILFFTSILISDELKIKADLFNGDEKAGISTFEGNVNIIKGSDELNASKVTIYTDADHQPTKFVAKGNVSFYIKTQQGPTYKGVSQEVIYLPQKKEYHFFKNVHLQQTDDRKEIIGDAVVLKTIEGKAYAKGAKSDPVIMIFKIKEEEK